MFDVRFMMDDVKTGETFRSSISNYRSNISHFLYAAFLFLLGRVPRERRSSRASAEMR